MKFIKELKRKIHAIFTRQKVKDMSFCVRTYP